MRYASPRLYELTPEHLNIRVEGNDGLEALDSHHVNHGLTPFSSSHLRIASTAPLSVSGDGCGRWNTRTTPNRNTSTREPSPSASSAPNSRNSASISAQRILPEAGREKIRSSVLWCLRFMGEIVSNYSINIKAELTHGSTC